MKKRIVFAVIGLLILIAVLGALKSLQIVRMIDQAKQFVPPPETVTAAAAQRETWETVLTAIGTLTAVQGVTIAAELPGKVVGIDFEAGSSVKRGDVLVRQDTSSEEALLPGALAQVTLTQANLARADQLLEKGIIARVDRDNAVAAAAQAAATTENIRASIAKKRIRAPFSGHLGIRLVNLGQILREGDPIVALQSLDPIHVDFTLPEQHLALVRAGLTVRVTGDVLPGGVIEGRITAINPQVDVATRSVTLQATLANPGGKLRPGMFVNVAIGLPARQKVLVIPATAVLYAPFGDSVFVIEEQKEGKAGHVLRQQFVRLGERRGDLVAVVSGLDGEDPVVSTGVFKLRNGQTVVVDNTLAPAFEAAPVPENK